MANQGDFSPSEASPSRAYDLSLEDSAVGTDLPRNSISLDPGTVNSSVPESLIGFNGLQELVPPLIPERAFMEIQNSLTGAMFSRISNGGTSHAPWLNHLHQGQSFAGNYYGDHLTRDSLNSSLGYDLGNHVNWPFVGFPFGERIGARLPTIPNLLTNPILFPINNGPFFGHNNPWVAFHPREAMIRNSSSESNASTEDDSVTQNLWCNMMLLGTGLSKEKILRLLNGDLSLFDELQGQDIISIAKYWIGAQYLQRFLVMEDPESIKKIFDGAIRSIFDLMSNKFGSSLFQKLLDYCNLDQIKGIVLEVTQRHGLIDVANDQYGTYSVQKLLTMLKLLNLTLVERVMSTLAPGLDLLMKSKTGSLLIQHCLSDLDHKQNEFIYNAAIKNCLTLASDEQGYVSLNHVIETIRNPHREKLLWTITSNSAFLAQDRFGNYVVQNVLELRDQNFTNAICYHLRGNYERLSMQIYGSHVVEKCLTSTGIEYVVMDFLLSDRLIELAQDPHGNYVIQTALKITKRKHYHLYKNLVIAIIPHFPRLRKHPKGSIVLNLINEDFPSIPA